MRFTGRKDERGRGRERKGAREGNRKMHKKVVRNKEQKIGAESIEQPSEQR